MKKSIAFVALLFTVVAFAQENKAQIPQISVTGEGKVKVTPDRAIINVGVLNTGKDAKEVKALNDETIDKVIKFLKKSGLNAADYKTNNVNLHKNYDYEKKKQVYQANQSISITLKELSKYDEIMMGLNDSGVNNIQGVEFKSSKMEELEKEARKKAMLNAKQKAEDYVSVLGQKIGKALLISDSSHAYYPQPMYKNSMVGGEAMVSGDSQETLAVGEIEITANVNVTFVLD